MLSGAAGETANMYYYTTSSLVVSTHSINPRAELDVPVLVPAGVARGVHAAAALARPRLLLEARRRRDQRGVRRRGRIGGQPLQGRGRLGGGPVGGFLQVKHTDHKLG